MLSTDNRRMLVIDHYQTTVTIMEGISDIRVSGLDQRRPPRIRKEPYINLYFTLNHKAPADWCSAFNDIASKGSFPVKIDPDEGMYIETWVRIPEQIEATLNDLKLAVTRCSTEYIEKIKLAASMASRDDGKGDEEVGEQGRLNRIIASLKFDD